MIRPIRSSFSKVKHYLSKCYLPAHLACGDNLVMNFYMMYGEGEYFTKLCNELQLQRVLVEHFAGFASDINFHETLIENLDS